MTINEHAQPTLSSEVKRDLKALLSMLMGVRGPIRKRIPDAPMTLPEFSRKLLGTLTSLTMLQQELLARITRGEAQLGVGPPPKWTTLLSSWVTDEHARITARRATAKLFALFDSLNSRLCCLDDTELANLPPDARDVPEFLALASSAIDHLAWFLQLDLYPRLFPEEPSSNKMACDPSVSG